MSLDAEDPLASSLDAGDDAYPLEGEARFKRLPLRLPPGFTFYLGTHHPAWLETATVPLFLSRRALVLDPAPKGSRPETWPRYDRQRRTLPRARVRWALDSAGFTELNQFGCHHIPPAQYAAEVCRYADEIGGLDWAAVQDWMCEPHVLDITRQSVDRHQRRTIESLLELRTIAPHLPWAPVLQGWFPGDHERHLLLYAANGFDLRCERIVGVGSVCRRQGMEEADEIVRRLSRYGIPLHVFGYKFSGLPETLRVVRSADSLAWSLAARKQGIQMPGHDHGGPLTGERWARRGHPEAHLRRAQKGRGWEVLWEPAAKSGRRTAVPDREAGRAALHAARYHRVGALWSCANCPGWAELWRNNMLALALGTARPDTVSRRYGYQIPTPAERAELAAESAAHTYGDMMDALAEDYEATRQYVRRVARVRLPRRPRCAILGEGAPCAPARYLPPGAPPPRWPPPPPVAVQPIPPPDAPVRDFTPWRPATAQAVAALDEHTLVRLAEEAAEFIFDPTMLLGLGDFANADLLYRLHTSRRQDLFESRAGGQLKELLRDLDPAERAEVKRLFEGHFARALYDLCRAAVPEVEVAADPPPLDPMTW